MRRLLLLALLLVPARLEAAVAFAQSAGVGGAAGSATLTAQFGSTPTAGSTIIACAYVFNSGGAPTGNTVTDDGGNTYTLIQGDTHSSNSRFECFGAYNISGVVASYDVIWDAAGAATVSGTFTITELTGTATSPLDQSNVSNPGNTSGPTGTAITSAGNGMHLTFLGWDNFSVTHTPAAGWTEAIEQTRAGNTTQAISYRAAATSVSQTPGATLSGSSVFCRYIHMTLLESGGGGGGSTAAKNCPMIGVCE